MRDFIWAIQDDQLIEQKYDPTAAKQVNLIRREYFIKQFG